MQHFKQVYSFPAFFSHCVEPISPFLLCFGEGGARCSPRPSLVICERGGHVQRSLTTSRCISAAWLCSGFLAAQRDAGSSMWALALWEADTNESWQAPQACGEQRERWAGKHKLHSSLHGFPLRHPPWRPRSSALRWLQKAQGSLRRDLRRIARRKHN